MLVYQRKPLGKKEREGTAENSGWGGDTYSDFWSLMVEEP